MAPWFEVLPLANVTVENRRFRSERDCWSNRDITPITTTNLSFRWKLWETISLPRRNNEKAQTWKKQSGSLCSRTRLHGNELWLRSGRRQEGNDLADSDGSRTRRHILR